MATSISPNNITCASGDLAIKLQPGNILSLANNAINCSSIVANDGSFNVLNVKTLNAGSLVVPDDTFTDITATTISLDGSASSVSVNSSSMMWNISGAGETDFVNQYGTGSAGGYNFYAIGGSNGPYPLSSSMTPIVKIDSGGNITATGDLHVDGFIDGVINNPGFTFLPIDISANYANNWTAVTGTSGSIWSAIAMSSSGQYQTASGTDSSGIGYLYRSSNFGSSWSKAVDTNGGYNASAIAISSTGQYQLAGYNTGDYFFSTSYGVGVWPLIKICDCITSVAMSASGKYQLVYGYNLVSTVYNSVIYISSNYGESFSLASASSPSSNVNTRACAMSSSGQYITISIRAGSNDNAFHYSSSDYGSTWSETLITGYNFLSDSIAISASGQYQTATYRNGYVYMSNDYGSTWKANPSLTTTTATTSTAIQFFSVSMSASGQYQTIATQLISGTTYPSIYYSTDYGVTWSSSSTPNCSLVAVSASGQFQTAVPNVSGSIYTCNITNSTASSSPVNTDTSGNIICTSLTTTGTAGVTTGVVSATTVSASGTVSAATVSAGTVSAGYVNSSYLSVNNSTPNVGLSLGLSQGSYMMWNASGGTAETDFVNIVPPGTDLAGNLVYDYDANAGFKFFNVLDTSGAGWYGINPPIAQIHSDGTFVCNAINVGGHSIVSNSREDLSFQGGSVTIKGYDSFDTSEMNNQLGTELVDISSNNYGLLVQYRIACGAEVDVFSDKRIKSDILDISSENSLNQVRKLQPKTFKYIDNTVNSKINYGFIAQDVDEVFSEGVTKIRSYIPNIFQQATISNKNIITFINFSTSDMLNDSNKIKLTVKDKEEIVTIKEILDEHSFSINEDILEDTCFVYGQEVNDLHVLEKNAIFTLTTSAVKQLDVELQELKQINENQQNEIEILKKEFDELKQLLLSKISE